MATLRDELNQLRAEQSASAAQATLSPRQELEQLRSVQQQPEVPIAQPEAQPLERPTAFLPTGEPLTQTQRQVRGKKAVEEAIEPILTGGGAALGLLLLVMQILQYIKIK